MQQISTFKDKPEKKLIPKYLKLEAQSRLILPKTIGDIGLFQWGPILIQTDFSD